MGGRIYYLPKSPHIRREMGDTAISACHYECMGKTLSVKLMSLNLPELVIRRCCWVCTLISSNTSSAIPVVLLPTDTDAENFMKSHVEPTIGMFRLLSLAPWYGKKHRDNTLTMKRFRMARCSGALGKRPQNYREKSVDVVGYDELSSFDEDIEKKDLPPSWGQTY
jgi:hypothetical protein